MFSGATMRINKTTAHMLGLLIPVGLGGYARVTTAKKHILLGIVVHFELYQQNKSKDRKNTHVRKILDSEQPHIRQTQKNTHSKKRAFIQNNKRQRPIN